MKIIVVGLTLLLTGCGGAKDFGALLYCAAHQNDTNRRCN